MSDIGQAAYNAISNRVYNGDIGQAVQSALEHKIYNGDIGQKVYEAFQDYSRPCVLFRPKISLDGNMYCVLLGEDLVAGVAGFGETMAKAMEDFDRNFYQQKAPSPKVTP